jgi:hypothetical protein
MIGPGTGVRVYLACGVTDMRKGIAGLAAPTQDVLRQKPASGAAIGVETVARTMIVIETAKLNGLDPLAYQADIHDHKINRLDELLPWN